MVLNLAGKHKKERNMHDRKHLLRDSFDSLLAELIQDPPEGSIKQTITPSMAADMLKWNDRNRPCTQSKVKLYARQMAAGDWHYTRVPIIFSKQRLMDGQHRLQAVIESEAPLVADVVFGAPDDAFSFIDVGKPRSAADIFAINGVQNYATMSAAIGWVVRYDEGRRHIAAQGGLTGAELYAEYEKRVDIQNSFWVSSEFNKSRLAPPSMMCAMHYICAQKARRDADEFFEAVAHGSSDRKSPAVALHSKLIRNATSQEKLSPNHLAGLTLTAWNLKRLGRTGARLSFDPEKPFPRAR